MSDKLSIIVNGEEREIFMSFGLLNHLCNVVGTIENVPLISIDVELRNTILPLTLAERTKSGKLINKELPEVDDFEITVEDGEKLLEWVTDHAGNFFIKALETARRLESNNKDRLQGLMQSSDGSKS